MPKSIFVLLAAVAVLRILSLKYDYPEGKLVRIQGRLTSEPRIYGNSRYISLHGLSFYVDVLPEINYGDHIVVEGRVAGDKLLEASVRKLETGGGFYALRKSFISFYQKVFPEPHASLIAGIVLGSKAGLPEDFWEMLKSTSTAHVVVASGMNVTLVMSFLLNLFINVTKRHKAIMFAVVGAWLYVVISGFDAPLVRAAVMGSIAFGAQAAGRISSAIRALFLSAFLMLIARPAWAHDLGFILSFVATLSIIIFEPKVSALLSKMPIILKKDLATTIAAQIGVAPIIYASFGTFNIFSPIINAIVLWTIPPIMILGGLAGSVGIFFEPLGRALGYLVFPFTLWFVKVIEHLS